MTCLVENRISPLPKGRFFVLDVDGVSRPILRMYTNCDVRCPGA